MKQCYGRFSFLLIACLLLKTTSWAGGRILPFEHQTRHMEQKPGAAMFDYDNDGDLDIYMINGERFPNRLLKNDGRGNFTDVAARAGVADIGHGLGAATADIDNDGDSDLYVTNNGDNTLYLNNGDGTFTDITDAAGVISPFRSTTCAFADIDSDGYVDLYVGTAHWFYGFNDLYRNNGDLTFTNISEQTGTGAGYSWSVAFCDYDNDGDQDIFTANDQGISKEDEVNPVMLFRNDGNLNFTNVTSEAGLSATGLWMGLAFSDYDFDGDFDLFATNVGTSREDIDFPDTRYHAFYRNNGNGTFTNVAEELGLARWEFGWGTVFTDFDNDGDSDLYYVGNFPTMGVEDNPGHLFINNSDGTFTESTGKYGLWTQDKTGKNTYAVGLAAGDVNNDGHQDLFVVNAAIVDTPAYPILFAEKFDDNHWIRIRLEGTMSNRSAIGARVSVTAGGQTQIQEVASGGSSFSQHSLDLTFGLGTHPRADVVEIRWPSGTVETFESVDAGQTVKIRESNSQVAVAVESKGKGWTTLGQIKHNALFQNYPNPFNPETWMPYQIAADVEVSISIYSIDNSLIRQIEFGKQKAGTYRFRERAAYWDGRDMYGEQVSSGVYFFQMRAGNFTAQRKMVILK